MANIVLNVGSDCLTKNQSEAEKFTGYYGKKFEEKILPRVTRKREGKREYKFFVYDLARAVQEIFSEEEQQVEMEKNACGTNSNTQKSKASTGLKLVTADTGRSTKPSEESARGALSGAMRTRQQKRG